MIKKKIIMISLASLAIIATVIAGAIYIFSAENENLVYVFEIARHGARAPMMSGLSGFGVKNGMLTA